MSRPSRWCREPTTQLKARLALIDSVVSSLDIKYFIWKGDESSRLVTARLLEAGMRSVRVRILIDDLNLVATDEEIAAVDKQGKH